MVKYIFGTCGNLGLALGNNYDNDCNDDSHDNNNKINNSDDNTNGIGNSDDNTNGIDNSDERTLHGYRCFEPTLIPDINDITYIKIIDRTALLLNKYGKFIRLGKPDRYDDSDLEFCLLSILLLITPAPFNFHELISKCYMINQIYNKNTTITQHKFSPLLSKLPNTITDIINGFDYIIYISNNEVFKLHVPRLPFFELTDRININFKFIMSL